MKALQKIVVEDKGKTLAIRIECQDVCGNVTQAVGVAIPLTIEIFAQSS